MNKVIYLLILMSVTAITYSQPNATVQFFGGYSYPMADLRGSFGETYGTWTSGGNPDTGTYFMKSGINYGIYVKFPFTRKSHLQLVGGIGFDAFSNSATYNNSNDTTGAGSFDLTQSHLVVIFGAEYNFATAKSKVNPFFGMEGMLNVIGGKLTADYPAETFIYTMNSTIRLGLQLGGGVDFVVHHNIGLLLGAKYAFANLIGKSYEPDLGFKYHLGDGEHELNGSKIPAKNIQYFHFYGGLSFYFGR